MSASDLDRNPQSSGIPGPVPDAALSIDTQLNERAYRGVLLHLSALRMRLIPLAIGIAGMLAFASGLRTEAFGLFAALVAIPFVVWGYLSWMSASPSSRSLYVPVRYTFEQELLRYESEEGNGEIPWQEITRWREATGHLLLYVTSSRYLVIPVEHLAEEVRISIEHLLGEKVGKRRGKKTSLR